MAEKLNMTEPLSDYIVSDQAGQLPPAVIERAKTHILDTFGAMISGSALKPGTVAIDFVRRQGGPQRRHGCSVKSENQRDTRRPRQRYDGPRGRDR